MLERFRSVGAKIMGPLADLLVRRGVPPDVITWLGTAATVVAALVCFPRGMLWQGALLVGVFACADMLDGQVARRGNGASRWGAFLDSTLDRVADGAVLGAVALFFARTPETLIWSGVTLWGLVAGEVTSYAKARAEALGFQCGGGLAARTDRLVIVLLGCVLQGLGIAYALVVAVGVLAVVTTVTVAQRMAMVHRQLEPDRERVHG